jgi:hydroxymethylbilane synthase
MARTIIVGSRQSLLAMTQTKQVIERLEAICGANGLDYRFEIRPIVTKGDRIVDVTLSKVGGKGLFVKEIEQALLAGDIDFAVHSMKDMPAELPEGLVNGATPARVDPRDCLISRDGLFLNDLPRGAVVGTSSLRRAAQLKAFRPDLDIRWIRGNIDTRLRKLETEDYAAIVLAAAGLIRLGWEERIVEYLPEDLSIPAVGQGALAIECRRDDEEVMELLGRINDPATDAAVRAERSFLHRLNGGCQVPIGAHAKLSADGQTIRLTGMVGDPDGSVLIRDAVEERDPEQAGIRLAESLLRQGAARILEQARMHNPPDQSGG